MEKFTERREEKRFNCRLPLTVLLSSLKKTYSATALNCSEEGIAFETDHELKVGATIYIRKIVCSKSDDFRAVCPFSRLSSFATVKWVNENDRNGTGAYLVGAKNFDYGSYY